MNFGPLKLVVALGVPLLITMSCKTRDESLLLTQKSSNLLQTGVQDPIAGFGFSPQTPAAKKGLENIFNGNGFYMYIPYRFLEIAKKIDKNPLNIIDFSSKTTAEH